MNFALMVWSVCVGCIAAFKSLLKMNIAEDASAEEAALADDLTEVQDFLWLSGRRKPVCREPMQYRRAIHYQRVLC